MRTYRCTAAECGEAFDVERHKPGGMRGSVHCVFCGRLASVVSTWEAAHGFVAGEVREPHASFREQGRQAARDGKPLSANPHLGGKGGKRHRAWREGWESVVPSQVGALQSTA